MNPLELLLSIGGKVIDRVFPDPTQKAAAQLELFKLQQSGELASLAAETDLAKGQQNINIEEAKNPSVFVSGWRPFIGWVCGAAFALNFVIGPIATFSVLAYTGKTLLWPTLDVATIMPVLLGMLGLGALRSYDKKNRLS
jgi:hypothetical protein